MKPRMAIYTGEPLIFAEISHLKIISYKKCHELLSDFPLNLLMTEF